MITLYIHIYATMGSKSTFGCVIELCRFEGVENGAVVSLFHTFCYVNDQTLIGNGFWEFRLKIQCFGAPCILTGPWGN